MLSVGADLSGRERCVRGEERRGGERRWERTVWRNTCCCFWAQLSPSPSSPFGFSFSRWSRVSSGVSTPSSGTGTSKGGRS